MTLATIMAADLTTIAADVPATLVAGSVSVAGTCSAEGRQDDVAEDGILYTGDVSFVARQDAFTAGLPALRSTVTLTCAMLGLTDQAYHVLRRDVDPGCVTLGLQRVA